MVVTENAEQVDAALQPFHEYECTGVKDEYVVFVDHDDEMRKEWGESTETVWVSEAGDYVDRYGTRFYREPTPEESAKIGSGFGSGVSKGVSYVSNDWGDGKGHRPKVKMSDEEIQALGYTSKKVPVSESGEYSCIEEYSKEWHGYDAVVNGRIGTYTNPDYKWDRSIATFAFLKDGEWVERGEMGWWGAVTDDAGREWYKGFKDLLDTVPDDALITIVDWHI